jgi:hypothetical protein
MGNEFQYQSREPDMWPLTIIANTMIFFLFWVAGFLAISPAFNHFVQYAHVVGEFSLPILTDSIFSVRLTSLAIPAGWLLGSFFFWLWVKKKQPEQRAHLVQFHTSASILVGLLMFVIFLTAGILPYLKIGAFFD